MFIRTLPFYWVFSVWRLLSFASHPPHRSYTRQHLSRCLLFQVALERVSYNLTAVSHPPATTGTTTRSNRLYKHCQLSKSRNCCQWNTVNKILINRPRPPSGRADEDLLLSLPLLRWKTVSGTAQDLDFGWLPRSLHLNFRAASWFDGVKERSAIPVSVFRFQIELNVSIDWVQMLVKCSLFFLRQAWLSST